MYGIETEKNHHNRIFNGFYQKYMQGLGLDIGYRGEHGDINIQPAINCVGIDLDYPNYDGYHLPFGDETVDFVYTSHVLEHIPDYKLAIQEWFRVTKTNGYIILNVPHQFLCECKETLPSIWNLGHVRFYTPASLCREIEESLEPNSYRIVHLRDNDDNYDYSIVPPSQPQGSFEIECVIQKIVKPNWRFLK